MAGRIWISHAVDPWRALTSTAPPSYPPLGKPHLGTPGIPGGRLLSPPWQGHLKTVPTPVCRSLGLVTRISSVSSHHGNSICGSQRKSSGPEHIQPSTTSQHPAWLGNEYGIFMIQTETGALPPRLPLYEPRIFLPRVYRRAYPKPRRLRRQDIIHPLSKNRKQIPESRPKTSRETCSTPSSTRYIASTRHRVVART